MKIRELRRVQAQPGMTAMIDIIFLLLLFFVLSSTFIVQPGIKINLPQTVSTEQPTRKDLVVIVARDLRIFVNNDQVTFESLWGRLIEELKFQRQGTLVLRADRDVPHGFVVRIMDVAKQAGAKRIAIATSPVPRKKKR
jgi:biopolymer transport protein ExbD